MSSKTLVPAKHLCKAIDIRAYVLEQETKFRATNKKATNQKRRLLKVQQALKRAYEDIDHFHLNCTRHILEKTTLQKELKKMLENIS